MRDKKKKPEEEEKDGVKEETECKSVRFVDDITRCSVDDIKKHE